MSSQATKDRVLLIGIVQDGKVVQERAMSAGETVSIGSDSKATFVVDTSTLPGGSFDLFSYDDGSYTLRFVSGVRGRITSQGERISLDKMAKDGSGAGSDGVFGVPLSFADKGKVRLDNATILFKFVEPTTIAKPAAAVEKLDFRPRWIEDDEDPIFVGFLAIWVALAIVFSVWVYTAEVPEYTLEDIPDRFTREVFLEPPEVEDLEELDAEETEDPDGVIQKEAPAEKAPEKVEPKDKPEPGSKEAKVDQAEKVAEAKEDLQESSALFKELQARMIGTTGENASGTVLLDNAVGDYDGIAERLADAEAAGGTIGDGSAIRGQDAVPGGSGKRDIGGIEGGSDVEGGVATTEAPKVEAPKGDVSTGDLDFGGGDVAAVQKVVRRYSGQIKYCYESRLKSNPSLAGRVEVSWFVEGGSASDVFVTSNTTGDKALGDCVVKKINRWRFTGEDEGEATTTFVFAPQE